jgi:hypothetical protein
MWLRRQSSVGLFWTRSWIIEFRWKQECCGQKNDHLPVSSMKLVSTQNENNQNIHFHMLGWGAGPGVKSHIPLDLNKKSLGEFSCVSGDIARGCWQRLLIQEIFQPVCALHWVYYSTYKHVSVFVLTVMRFQNMNTKLVCDGPWDIKFTWHTSS